MPKTATACNCTICAKMGTLWAYGTEGHDLHVTGRTCAYRRQDQTALEFLYCATCGNTVAWRMRGDAIGKRAAINLRLTNTPSEIMDLTLHRFDGRDSWNTVDTPAKTVRDVWF